MLLELIVGVLQPVNYNRPVSLATAPEMYVESSGVMDAQGNTSGPYETAARTINNNKV